MKPDDKLRDDVLHHTLNLFRLSASQVTATMRRLKAMEKQLISELAQPLLTDAKKSEIKAVLANAEDIISDYYADIESKLNAGKVAETVASASRNSLTVALGLEAASMPTQAYFKSVASDVLIQGSPAKEWWKAQARDTAFKFSAAVRQGLINNETNQQIIGRIVGTRAVPGVMDIARKHAASLVQTSVQAVANDARLATFRQNSDVVSAIMQVSTLDSHTSDICMAYSGATWDLDGNPLNGSPDFNGGPPRHFNCRSVLVPITKSFRELGIDIDEPRATTRASDEGQVKADMSFDTFLKRKGEDFQNEMLGEGRADLWRDGKITLRDLVSGQGRPLTLEELQTKFNPNELMKWNKGVFTSVSGKEVEAVKVHALKEAHEVAKKMNFPIDDIRAITDNHITVLNGEEYYRAGGYSPHDGVITLNVLTLPPNEIRGVVAHEITHHKYETVLKSIGNKESYLDKPIFNAYGMHKHGGITEYSKSIWDAYLKGEVSEKTAFHETLAEMASELEKTGKLPGNETWRDYFNYVDKKYKELVK